MTKLIALYGGPGCGKSTTAAALFARMKVAGKNVELCREIAKDLTWQGVQFNEPWQASIIGKQILDESHLVGKVDAVITDGPVLLNAYYCTKGALELVGVEFAHWYMNWADHAYDSALHVLLRRKKPFSQAGRQAADNEEACKRHDAAIRVFVSGFVNLVTEPHDLPESDRSAWIEGLTY